MKTKVVPFAAFLGCFFVCCVALTPRIHAQGNVNIRVMAANLNGNSQTYEPFALRIFQALKPDVVAIQEFNYTSTNGVDVNNTAAIREMVDVAFGTNYYYFRGPTAQIPNGIISRYPIITSSNWTDTLVANRGFAWAQIDLPGTNDLYIVSVHFLTTSSANRTAEANNLKALMQASFPANAWIVVAGDFNAGVRSESCVTTWNGYLSDLPVPKDKNGVPDTNAGRTSEHDYVLLSLTLTNYGTATAFPTLSYPNGLVFDSRLYTAVELSANFPPVLAADSGNAQHMAVIKDFLIPTNGAPVNTPPSITAQPISLTNTIGANISFSVTASGSAPLAFQWRFFGANISGATTNPFSISNIQPTNAGNYTVVITNLFGSVTSSIATLTVNATPFISSQPQSLSVNLGANAAFNVTASGGTPLMYQWMFAGTNIPGATAASYTRTNARTVDAGNYSVVVSNYAGSVTSTFAVLSVNVTPPGIIAQWNFNSVPPDGLTTTGSTTPSIGLGTASLVGGATATFATGDSTLDPAGSTDNSAWNSTTYPAQGTGDRTRGVQFNVSTSGRQNILVTWATQDSSTGSRYSRLQYTTNGTTYTDFPTTTTNTTTVFTAKTNSLAAIPGVNDNPNFAIRFVTEFESSATGNNNSNYVAANSPTSSYGTGGTVRFDMMTIYGSTIIAGTAPTVTNQPASQTASQGDNITFTVGADGTAALTYQWRFNLTNISSATNSSYTRSDVQPAHVGSYSVVVSNSAGFTISSNAMLNLIVPQSVLTMTLAGVLQWQGLSNLSYTVQTSTNLAQTNWMTLGTAASVNATISFTNTPATNTERYYRVVYP